MVSSGSPLIEGLVNNMLDCAVEHLVRTSERHSEIPSDSRVQHLLSIFRNGTVHIHIDPRINFKINLHPSFNRNLKKKSNTNIMLKNIAHGDSDESYVYSFRNEHNVYTAPIGGVLLSPSPAQTSIRSARKKLGKYLKKLDISTLNSMKVIDKNFNDSQLYCVPLDDVQYLITNKKQIVGNVYSWIDECDEVPIDYKTTDNIVLHPNNQLPIIEIQITKVGSMYANISNGIYREYHYDDELECFRKTNNIISDIMT
tara:strand:+ start:10223 stop:10990 length:768 start_codon:yes stop_codon:yes gene_type:complete